MKLKQINLEDGQPTGLTVELSVDEAMHIAKWAGGLSPNTSPHYESTSSIYSALVGEFFNRFWYDGLAGALRGDDE